MADIGGTSGADLQTGGAGDDTLRSSAGDDAVSGGAGFDTYVLGLGRGGFVVTGAGDSSFTFRPTAGSMLNFGVDTVSGCESFRIVSSNTTVTVAAADMMARFNFGYSHAPTAGGDKLLGGFGADSIDGGAGDDTVEGGNGADRLDGGAGKDVLRGGAGADVFVFNAWEGDDDSIEDFEVGVDRIETHTAYGYETWVAEGADPAGRQGTWVIWGWNHDAVFLPGVSGVGLDALLA